MLICGSGQRGRGGGDARDRLQPRHPWREANRGIKVTREREHIILRRASAARDEHPEKQTNSFRVEEFPLHPPPPALSPLPGDQKGSSSAASCLHESTACAGELPHGKAAL